MCFNNCCKSKFPTLVTIFMPTTSMSFLSSPNFPSGVYIIILLLMFHRLFKIKYSKMKLSSFLPLTSQTSFLFSWRCHHVSENLRRLIPSSSSPLLNQSPTLWFWFFWSFLAISILNLGATISCLDHCKSRVSNVGSFSTLYSERPLEKARLVGSLAV